MIVEIYKRSIPPGPYDDELFELHNTAIPSLLDGIRKKAAKYFYATPQDWARGRQLLAMEGASLLMPATTRIVDATNRLWVLIDTTFNGHQYDDGGSSPDNGEQLYIPPINPFPDRTDFAYPGMHHIAVDGQQAWRNLLNGEIAGPYGQTEQVKQQLVAILQAIIDMQGQGVDYTPFLETIITALG